MIRYLTLDDIKQILSNRTKQDKYRTLKNIPMPYLFKDISKATKRIIKAIQTNEQIIIVGDYDADGVVSTAIMVQFLSNFTKNIQYIIPNRFVHGYGLSCDLISDINQGLIITVDNGISANEAANLCQQKNIDLIITDHHTIPSEIPQAYAIVNPKQFDCNFPFDDICGAQVAWYLCANIKQELKANINLMEYFDILSIAIIADMMPMVSLNQTLTKAGLKAFSNSVKPFAIVLKQYYNLTKITEDDIGFKIAPLINCAGRLDDARLALDFLLAQDINTAKRILDQLVQLNEQRKYDQLQIFLEAQTQVSCDDNVIVVASPNWNEGIIGIVASKLCEKYKKPSFVFSIKDNIAKASCRSTPDVHLYNLIDSCKDLLLKFGGHKQAAGLSIDIKNLDLFKTKLNQNILTLPKENTNNNLDVIGALSIEQVNSMLYETIESFRPFGQDNQYPIFLFKDLTIINIKKIGKNKEYTKLTITNHHTNIDLLIFLDLQVEFYLYDKITFTATISQNNYMGNISYNLLLKEILN